MPKAAKPRKPGKQLGTVAPQLPKVTARGDIRVTRLSLAEYLDAAAHYLGSAVCDSTQHDREGNTVPCPPCLRGARDAVERAYGPLCARVKVTRPGVQHPKLRKAELALYAKFPPELREERARDIALGHKQERT